MKTLSYASIVAAVLVFPLVAHAQDTASTVTHQQVREELAQLERAGYQPGHPGPHYPGDLQAAEARVHAMSGESAVGGVAVDHSQSGSRVVIDTARGSLFAHH